MGQMRFYAPLLDTLPPHATERAYLAGIEAIPWHSRNHWSDGTLCLDRSVSESGNLYIPWPVQGQGERVLSTCTLMERREPYHLATELARGTLHRARTLIADLESQQGAVPAEITRLLREAVLAFIDAATSTAGADHAAERSIALACNVIAQTYRDVVLDRIRAQRAEAGPLVAILAGRLGHAELDDAASQRFCGTFQAANLPFRWRDLQPAPETWERDVVAAQLAWCRTQGLPVFAGPLLQLDHASLPGWAVADGQRYDAFEGAARKYAQAVVRAFRDAVDVWICTGRLNVAGAATFSEEQRLRLAVVMIEAVRECCARAPVVVSFDQPWAEYLSTADYDLSPLHFADALVRAELGVGGIALEMNLGYWPGGCLPRDLLSISLHVDRWALLGIPLLVFLSMPSSGNDDAHATAGAAVTCRNSNRPQMAAMDQHLAAELVPMLLAKPAVHAVVWNQWSDREPHEFPHAGLLDQAGQPKPLLAQLAQIRRDLLA